MVDPFVRRALLPVVLVSLFVLAACSSQDDPAPTPSPVATATVTAVPTPSATVTPAATPLPTVAPPTLKLLLVNVATGAASSLPVGFGGFGRTPAWSPDSTRMAVADAEGLSMGALTAQNFTRLWAGSCTGVDWSPTVARIAAACKDGLVVLDTAGTVINRDKDTVPEWVRWSPDGEVVAYGSNNSPVKILKSDGSRTTVPGAFASAQWLPDGRLLTVEQPGYQDAATIRIHDPARDYADIVTRVTPAGAVALGFDREGKYAAYGVHGPSRGDQRILPSIITVVRVGDGQVMASFPTYAGYGGIDFSPDGRSILMQSDFCGPDWAVKIGGLDGSRRVIAPGSALYTKFSPDGAQVGILRGTELWVVPADGSAAARRIAEGLHGPAGFDWSPDGKWISVPPYFGGFGICP